MEQPVPSSELNLDNVGKEATTPQSIVVEETAGCHCKPKEEPEVQAPVEEVKEAPEDCPPAPPACRDPVEEPPKKEVVEPPPCPPCPPCPPTVEEPPKEEECEETPEPEKKLFDEEEDDKFPRPPCPEPLYPPCKPVQAPCQTIVCPQDD